MESWTIERVIAIILYCLCFTNSKTLIITAQSRNLTIIYRDYLKYLVDIADYSVDPCHNFFKHACGGFDELKRRQSYGDSSELSSDYGTPPFLYNQLDYYKFFKENKHMFLTKPGIMLRNVYDTCEKSKKNGKRSKWLHIMNEMEFLKGDRDIWSRGPFLLHQWALFGHKLNMSWPELSAEFAAHGLKIFVNIFFADHTIYLAPNDDLMCSELSTIKGTLLSLLRHHNSQVAEIIGNELYSFCRQLKGDINISAEVHQTINILDDAIMVEYFQTYFARLNFTNIELKEARKITINVERFTDLINVLRTTEPRIVFNFILWYSYQQLASVSDDCFHLINEFEELLHVEYWNWEVFRNQFGRNVGLASYLYHTTRFQRHYRKVIISASLDILFGSKEMRKDLNIERSIRKYAKEHLDLDSYTNVFNSQVEVALSKLSFFAQLFEMRRLLLRFSFLRPYKDLQELNFFKKFIQFSILLYFRPRLHYFASLDREMWQESKILQSSDGYYTAMDCLERQSNLHSEEFNIYDTLSVEQIKSVFDFYTSYIQALQDYTFWLDGENFALAEDFLMEYFELDVQRIMFYSVAQQFCSRNNYSYSILINRSYMNMPEFQEAFNCSASSPMNPLTKCMINQCR